MPENKQACSRRLDAERTQEHGTARAQPVCIFNQGSLLCTLIDIIMPSWAVSGRVPAARVQLYDVLYAVGGVVV